MGKESVFTIVPVPVLVTEFAVALKVKAKSGEWIASVRLVMFTVLLVSPALNVSVPEAAV